MHVGETASKIPACLPFLPRLSLSWFPAGPDASWKHGASHWGDFSDRPLSQSSDRFCQKTLILVALRSLLLFWLRK
jgi:hypothetical protein